MKKKEKKIIKYLNLAVHACTLFEMCPRKVRKNYNKKQKQ